MTELEGIYCDLRSMGIVRSQYELSRCMGQSQSYYSSLKARDGRPSSGALIALYLQIDEILARLEDAGSSEPLDEKKERLDNICQSIWLELQDRYLGSEASEIFDMRCLLSR